MPKSHELVRLVQIRNVTAIGSPAWKPNPNERPKGPCAYTSFAFNASISSAAKRAPVHVYRFMRVSDISEWNVEFASMLLQCGGTDVGVFTDIDDDARPGKSPSQRIGNGDGVRCRRQIR